MYNLVLHFSFDQKHPSEVKLPMLPLFPPWLTLQSHQSQSTHTKFLSDETKMEDAVECAPTTNVFFFHKTRLDLFGQTPLKTHSMDTGASALSVSLCKSVLLVLPIC